MHKAEKVYFLTKAIDVTEAVVFILLGFFLGLHQTNKSKIFQ